MLFSVISSLSCNIFGCINHGLTRSLLDVSGSILLSTQYIEDDYEDQGSLQHVVVLGVGNIDSYSKGIFA